MLKKMRGFTLIELLIVVAIIGILAALLIPNALEAIQKAKQKSAMKEIQVICTACVDYITDHGSWLNVIQDGDLTSPSSFTTAIATFYVKVLPVNDPWNFPYKAYCGKTAVDGYITGGTADTGDDDVAVASWGRDGTEGPIYMASIYSTTTPEAGRYNVSRMSDFNYDLVSWNGSWIVGPKLALATGS